MILGSRNSEEHSAFDLYSLTIVSLSTSKGDIILIFSPSFLSPLSLSSRSLSEISPTICPQEGGHVNPAVTFGMFLARKVSLARAVAYIVAQCLGAICGAAIAKSIMKKPFNSFNGGTNTIAPGYSIGTALGAEIIGTFFLVYTVFSATDPKRNARDSHVPVLAPLPIGFAVIMVHLATIPITGTGINPARSLGAAVMYNNSKSWKNHWIFWVGPMAGAAAAAAYHQYVLRAAAVKALGSFRSNARN